MHFAIALLSVIGSTAFALPAQQHHHHHHNTTAALEDHHHNTTTALEDHHHHNITKALENHHHHNNDTTLEDHHHHHNTTNPLEKKHVSYGWVGSFADSNCYGAVSVGDVQNMNDPNKCYPFNPVPNQHIGINWGGSKLNKNKADAVRFFTDDQCQNTRGSQDYVHTDPWGATQNGKEYSSPCLNYDGAIKAVKMFSDPNQTNRDWWP